MVSLKVVRVKLERVGKKKEEKVRSEEQKVERGHGTAKQLECNKYKSGRRQEGPGCF
jgi:hypothetical protein